MEKFRFIIVAASALTIGGALAIGTAQAAVQGGADAIRAASENGSITEQAQYRWGGYDYCWADDGWRGPGWYWCGYAYRRGFGWGGPIGWNKWRFRGRGDFRDVRSINFSDSVAVGSYSVSRPIVIDWNAPVFLEGQPYTFYPVYGAGGVSLYFINASTDSAKVAVAFNR